MILVKYEKFFSKRLKASEENVIDILPEGNEQVFIEEMIFELGFNWTIITSLFSFPLRNIKF